MSDWVVIHDNGHGITAKSLELLSRYLPTIRDMRPYEVVIDFDRIFRFEIKCLRGVVLLSGLNCGYGGEGPHGSVRALEMLIGRELTPEERAFIFEHDHVVVDLRREEPVFKTTTRPPRGESVLKWARKNWPRDLEVRGWF